MLLLAACGDGDVTVTGIPVEPGVSERQEAPVPGFPDDGKVTHGSLDSSDCGHVNPQYIVDGTSVGSRPKVRPNGASDPFVVWWTLCNQTRFHTDGGLAYDLVIDESQVVNGQPQTSPASPPKVSLTAPPLDSCKCFTQEVGINRSVPPEAFDQANVSGVSPTPPHPQITLAPFPDGKYIFSLSSPFADTISLPMQIF